MGAGRDTVQPEQFVKDAQLERRAQVPAKNGGPKKPDYERALKQGGIEDKAKGGTEDKKKATLNTCRRMSA